MVQVVDYHAVALRSRAVQEVGLQAAQLSDQYYQGLLSALLGWRGIQDGDAAARRVAADAIGRLVWGKIAASGSYDELTRAIDLVGDRLRGLSNREVEGRHGLILALTAIVEKIPSTKEGATPEVEHIAKSVVAHVLWILENVNANWGSGRSVSLVSPISFSTDAIYFPGISGIWSSDRNISIVSSRAAAYSRSICKSKVPRFKNLQ